MSAWSYCEWCELSYNVKDLVDHQGERGKETICKQCNKFTVQLQTEPMDYLASLHRRCRKLKSEMKRADECGILLDKLEKFLDRILSETKC